MVHAWFASAGARCSTSTFERGNEENKSVCQTSSMAKTYRAAFWGWRVVLRRPCNSVCLLYSDLVRSSSTSKISAAQLHALLRMSSFLGEKAVSFQFIRTSSWLTLHVVADKFPCKSDQTRSAYWSDPENLHRDRYLQEYDQKEFLRQVKNNSRVEESVSGRRRRGKLEVARLAAPLATMFTSIRPQPFYFFCHPM